MSTSITSNDGQVSAPAAIMPLTLARRGRAVLHRTIGEVSDDVTYQAGGLRSGELVFMFTSETDALAALDMHAAAVWLDVDVSSSPLTMAMRYVVPEDSDLRLEQKPGNRVWSLTVPVQEIAT